MLVTENTKFKELRRIPQIGKNYKYVLYCPAFARPLYWNLTIKQMIPAGDLQSTLDGLNRLADVAAQGDYCYCLYPGEKGSKKDVSLTHFPAKNGSVKPTVILCPGGAYGAVAALTEGYPVAKQLNELGYHAFCLNYRVCRSKLMPQPIDDLATAVKFLQDNRKELNLSEEYIVCGFSAGGNLTTLWGTDHLGYVHYGLPKPKALFPIYPFVDYHLGDNPTLTACRNFMFGKKTSPETLHQYSPAEHVSAYPPCYIVNCLDDSTVSPENGVVLKTALDQAGIPCVLEQGEKGEHGFGDGKGTSVEGWIDRAITFVETLS